MITIISNHVPVLTVAHEGHVVNGNTDANVSNRSGMWVVLDRTLLHKGVLHLDLLGCDSKHQLESLDFQKPNATSAWRVDSESSLPEVLEDMPVGSIQVNFELDDDLEDHIIKLNPNTMLVEDYTNESENEPVIWCPHTVWLDDEASIHNRFFNTSPPRRRLGDSVGMTIVAYLTDPLFREHLRSLIGFENVKDVPFFACRRSSLGGYHIINEDTHTEFYVAPTLVRNRNFNVTNWIAVRVAKQYGRPRPTVEYPGCMGQPGCARFAELITNDIAMCYPTVSTRLDDDGRFAVREISLGHFILYDTDLDSEIRIPSGGIYNQNFDAIDWYRMIVHANARYEERYLNAYTAWSIPSYREQPFSSDSDDSNEENDCSSMPGLQLVSATESERAASVNNDAEVRDVDSDVSEEPRGPFIDYETSASLYSHQDIGYQSDTWSDLSLDSNEMNSVAFDQNKLWSLGEVLETQVQNILGRCQPYPGDDEIVHVTMNRFSVLKTSYSAEIIQILDYERDWDVYIHLDRLRDPSFSVGRWYAFLCAEQSRSWRNTVLTTQKWMSEHIRYHRGADRTQIGSPIELALEELLLLSAPYEGEADPEDFENPACRFMVERDQFNTDQFIIADHMRGILTRMPVHLTNDSYFNIHCWYADRLKSGPVTEADFSLTPPFTTPESPTPIEGCEDTWDAVGPLV
ncbi:hypothetical protein BJ165DRAFT_1410954 [Panaeolus papilionaceus]|nr:hypothetical protein BJ165DRAFT_1410954 [Panaeolus papilionaceus]